MWNILVFFVVWKPSTTHGLVLRSGTHRTTFSRSSTRHFRKKVPSSSSRNFSKTQSNAWVCDVTVMTKCGDGWHHTCCLQLENVKLEEALRIELEQLAIKEAEEERIRLEEEQKAKEEVRKQSKAILRTTYIHNFLPTFLPCYIHVSQCLYTSNTHA